MTTPAQVKANRRNSQSSTGPRTNQGKAIVCQNAVQHGLLSWKPVVADFEHEEEWNAHHYETLADLQPVGHLETVLAERIALLLWRIGRVARFELEAISTGLETSEDEWKWRNRNSNQPPLATLVSEANSLRELLDLLQQIENGPKQQKLDARLTANAIDTAARMVNVQIYDNDPEDGDEEDAGAPDGPEVSLPDFTFDKRLEEVDWTISRARLALSAIAKGVDQEMDELREVVLTKLREKVGQVKVRQMELDRIRRQRLMPDEKTMERIGRYEMAFERAMLRCLHELQRLQAARKGHGGPLPVALDVNLSGDAAH